MTEQPVAVLRLLWERMAVMYPYRWAGSNGETPEDETGAMTTAGDTWARGLAGLTLVEIARGFEALNVKLEEWPPGPQVFRALALGIPSLASIRGSFSSASYHSCTTPFAVMVWQELDAYRYRRAEAAAADRMLAEAYERAAERRMRGERLPAPPVGTLEAPKAEPKRPAAPESVRQHLADIEKLLGPRGDTPQPSAEPEGEPQP